MKQTQLSYPTAATMGYAGVSFETTALKPLQPSQPTSVTLATLPTAEANTVKIRDGEVVLFKRIRSRVWQCRFKLDDQRWHRQTTGQHSLRLAVESAAKLYDQARFAQQMGLSPTRKSFSQIAKFAVEEMRRERSAGTGKKIYDDYIQVIERYFVPFFGERQLQTLTHRDISDFEIWRNHKMGKRPKSSTLMTFASAFSRVCQTATERGWLSDRVILPKMSRKGEKGTARPAFSIEEIVALRSAMSSWGTGGRTAIDNDYRQLVCDYVEFLLLTGCRHGTEAMGVCWQHCEWYVSDGVKYLRVWVSGKTGGRWLIAKHSLLPVLQRLHSRQRDISTKELDSVLGRHSAYLFRSSDLRRPYSFNGLFSRLLKACGLLKNTAGEARTLYSLRHTYATTELLAGTDIHTLARQMGTSVLMLERHYSKLTATLAAGKLA